MIKPEILSPAGNTEKLYAAVRFGADAVYLAVFNFGDFPRQESVMLSRLGLPGGVHSARELWSGDSVNTQRDAFVFTVPGRDAVIFRIDM